MRFSAVGAMLAAMFLLAGFVSAEQTQEGLTSRNTRSLRVLLGWYPEADANGDGVLTTAELDAYRPAPQYVDVPYGEHKKQKIDLYLVPSDRSTPLVLYIHGGGFRGGDKGNIWPGLINRCHQAGISVASVNYRLRPEFAFPAPFEDAARAVQFLRHKAMKYNLDPRRFAGTGISAGGGIVLWLALHDDLAKPGAADSIARQSTRLMGAGVVNAQVSYDPRFYTEQGLVVPGGQVANLLWDFYDLREGQPPTRASRAVARQCAPLVHLSPDDPPMYFHYAIAGAGPKHPVLPHTLKGDDFIHDEMPPQSLSDAVHHPEQGRIMRRKARPLGVPVSLMSPPKDTEELEFVEFLVRVLERDP